MRERKSTHERGRGASSNPANRYQTLSVELDPEISEDPEEPRPARSTVFLRDASRSLIATNQSPDLGFDASVNPYRGCEHGCAYCYARPYHEYLGFSPGLDFETRIVVKTEAPALLRAELSKPGWHPRPLAFSGVTDAYQPVERRLRLTRACLEVLAEFRNPVGVVTKNHLVTRDADLLGQLASHGAAQVWISLASLDRELVRDLEPRTSQPTMRLRAMRELAAAGVPVGVAVGPVIPGLNDHEIPAVLEAAREAGASYAWYVLLRLPPGVDEVFTRWLEQHRPERAGRVLARIRDTRAGGLSDSRFGHRMRGQGSYAEQIRSLFQVSARRCGLDQERPELSAAAFRDPAGSQMRLFV
jgi:DNA repair photolyase